MPTKQKKTVPEATARPTLAIAKLRPDQIVMLTAQRSEVIKNAPGYASAQDVQKALGLWNTAADAVNKRAQAIQTARLALTALLAAQPADIATWKRATQTLLAAISAVAGGSVAALKAWGFGPAEAVVLTTTNDAPAKLRAGYTKEFALVLRWASVRGQRGYFVQIGDGTPQGWGTSIACPKASYVPAGLAPGQKVAVRVAVQRKSGLSAWSDALSITVR